MSDNKLVLVPATPEATPPSAQVMEPPRLGRRARRLVQRPSELRVVVPSLPSSISTVGTRLARHMRLWSALRRHLERAPRRGTATVGTARGSAGHNSGALALLLLSPLSGCSSCRPNKPGRRRLALRCAFVVRARASYPRFMASAVPIPPPGFDDLTPEEKVRYVGALWDRIVADQDQLPMSEAQRALIRQRLAAHEADPGAARPWSEVRREIEPAIRDRRSR
jgi:putative addiction module component (TIGR02574 family)